MHYKIGDKGYAYAEVQPGVHRIAALMDFSCIEKPFLDPERVKYLVETMKSDFVFPGEKWHQNLNLRPSIRPQTFDDMPIIGSLPYFPNVVVNSGHGGHGLSLAFYCA